jgi:hypothetical protein
MSGINTSLDYASLFNFSGTTTTTDSLLNTLYNFSATVTPTSALQSLQSAEANETQDVAQEAQQPSVQRDIATFTQAVQSATSVQQLLSNPTVLKVLLTANGLSDQVNYTALAQQALMSNPNDSNSLANTLSNTAWATAAKTYDFYDNGLSNIQQSSTIASIANAYAQQSWYNSLNATTPGLSNALIFRATAATDATSVDAILGNSVLRSVVTTALGLPEEIALQPLEAQETAITSRMDITQLQNPTFVDQFLQKYMIAEATSASSSTTSSDIFSTIASLTA